MTRKLLLASLILAALGVSSFGNAAESEPAGKIIFTCENFLFTTAAGAVKVKATVKVAELANGSFVAQALLNDRTITTSNIDRITSELSPDDLDLAAFERANPGIDPSKIASVEIYGDMGTGMISKDIPLSFTVFKDAVGATIAKVVAPQGGVLAGHCEK